MPCVMDVGSTKQMIVDAMTTLPAHLQAVGGHPMTGAVTAGTSQPTDRLFEGRAFVLCRTPSTRPETMAAVKQLLSDFKAKVVEMTAAEHDAAVALVSHLPQLLALPLAPGLRSRVADRAVAGRRRVSRARAGRR